MTNTKQVSAPKQPKLLSAKVGDVVNKMTIRVVFDPYFDRLLVPGFFEPLPRESRKAPPTYRIVQPIPSLTQYAIIKRTRYTTSVEDLLSEVSSGIEELGGELRSWHDNLPDGLNTSSKADEIDEAATTLEGITVPDLPTAGEEVQAFFLPGLDLDSRPKRAAEIGRIISAITSAVEDKKSELEQETPESEDIQEIESFIGEMEGAASELENVSFPSMM
jgi:hypothetical protein